MRQGQLEGLIVYIAVFTMLSHVFTMAYHIHRSKVYHSINTRVFSTSWIHFDKLHDRSHNLGRQLCIYDLSLSKSMKIVSGYSRCHHQTCLYTSTQSADANTRYSLSNRYLHTSTFINNRRNNYSKQSSLAASTSVGSSTVYEPLAHDIHRSQLVASPDDKLVVFLHGILGNKRNWRTPCMKWVQRHQGHQCVAVDHRGHGSSLQPHFIQGKHTVEQCAEDLNHLLDTFFENDAYILCAHSFGGKVALAYLNQRMSQGKSLPAHTWILDSIPGIYNREETGGQSVSQIFHLLSKLPRLMGHKGASHLRTYSLFP